ncbi:MAG: phosphatidylglycerophosphatase [Acidimicrobiaceae bacterium]|nr:phosphatidylglycerophosphatase [Acidimicrobiaceae bacterium]
MSRPEPDKSPARVAAFDFDGTLAPRDSLLPFLGRVAGRAPLGRALAVQWPTIALALAGRGDRDAAKVALVGRLLRGAAAEDVAARGEEYATVLAGRLRPHVAERLAWHRDQGHEVVIVSASLTAYLEPLGRRLGAHAVLATALEVGQDGRLTGKLVGANVRGPEKVARLEAYLAGRVCELWAYGDSEGDRELLAMADHPYRVSRRPLPAV